MEAPTRRGIKVSTSGAGSEAQGTRSCTELEAQDPHAQEIAKGMRKTPNIVLLVFSLSPFCTGPRNTMRSIFLVSRLYGTCLIALVTRMFGNLS